MGTNPTNKTWGDKSLLVKGRSKEKREFRIWFWSARVKCTSWIFIWRHCGISKVIPLWSAVHRVIIMFRPKGPFIRSTSSSIKLFLLWSNIIQILSPDNLHSHLLWDAINTHQMKLNFIWKWISWMGRGEKIVDFLKAKNYSSKNVANIKAIWLHLTLQLAVHMFCFFVW